MCSWALVGAGFEVRPGVGFSWALVGSGDVSMKITAFEADFVCNDTFAICFGFAILLTCKIFHRRFDMAPSRPPRFAMAPSQDN